MTRDVFRYVVSMVAGDMLDAAVVVLIDVVLCGEKVLRLSYSDVQLKVRKVLAKLDARTIDAVVDEPCMDSVDRLLRGPERLRHTFGCPALAILGGSRVSDLKEVIIEIMKVGLAERNAEGNDCVWVSTAVKGPSIGHRMPTFMEDAPRKQGAWRRASGTRYSGRKADKQLEGGKENHRETRMNKRKPPRRMNRTTGRTGSHSCYIALVLKVLGTRKAHSPNVPGTGVYESDGI